MHTAKLLILFDSFYIKLNDPIKTANGTFRRMQNYYYIAIKSYVGRFMRLSLFSNSRLLFTHSTSIRCFSFGSKYKETKIYLYIVHKVIRFNCFFGCSFDSVERAAFVVCFSNEWNAFSWRQFFFRYSDCWVRFWFDIVSGTRAPCRIATKRISITKNYNLSFGRSKVVVLSEQISFFIFQKWLKLFSQSTQDLHCLF